MLEIENLKKSEKDKLMAINVELPRMTILCILIAPLFMKKQIL